MSKKNLVVGQSGGATVVINQTLAGIIRQAQAEANVDRILGMKNGILGLKNRNFVDLTELNETQLQLLEQTPSSALGSCRYKMPQEDEQAVLDSIKENDISYFTLIGGNDSAETALHISKLAQKRAIDLAAIALPKTIDNDLPCMDHTPGYGSVATFIAAATKEAGRDTEAMKLSDPIKIIEVKGRNSGWTVASSALGKKSKLDAPHLIYFPEHPFIESKFVEDVKRVYDDIGYCVIVIAETLRNQDGRLVGERKEGIVKDSFGHAYVDSAAACLCRIVESELKLRARYDKPGTLQNSSIRYVSRVDQEEAQMAGKAAVTLAVNGTTDVIVTLERKSDNPYKCVTGHVPIAKIAGIEKYMPASYINEEGNFVTQEYIDYASPLIGEIPEFIRL